MSCRFSPFNPPIFNVQILIESFDRKKSDEDNGHATVADGDSGSAAFAERRQRYAVEMLYEGQVVSSQVVLHGVGRNLFLSARTQQLRVSRTTADVSGSTATIDLAELFLPTNGGKIHNFRLDAEATVLLASFEIGKRDRRSDGRERSSQTEATIVSNCAVQTSLAARGAAEFRHKLSQTDATNSDVRRAHATAQTTAADEHRTHYENEEMILSSDVLRRVLFHVVFALLRRLKSKTPVPAERRRKSAETRETAKPKVVKQVTTDISIPVDRSMDFLPTLRRQLRADAEKLEKTRADMRCLFATSGRLGAINNSSKVKGVRASLTPPAKVQAKGDAKQKNFCSERANLRRERRVIAESVDEQALSLLPNNIITHSFHQPRHLLSTVLDDKSLEKSSCMDHGTPLPISVGRTTTKLSHKDSLRLLKELKAQNQAATRPVVQQSTKMSSCDSRLGREAGERNFANEQSNNGAADEAIFTSISSRLPSPILEDENVLRSRDHLKPPPNIASSASKQIDAIEKSTVTSTSTSTPNVSLPKSAEDDGHSRSKLLHSNRQTHSTDSSDSTKSKTVSETTEEEHSSDKSSTKSATSSSGKSTSTTQSSLSSLHTQSSRRNKGHRKFASSTDGSSSATSSVPSEIIVQYPSGDSSGSDASSSSTLTRASNNDKTSADVSPLRRPPTSSGCANKCSATGAALRKIENETYPMDKIQV